MLGFPEHIKEEMHEANFSALECPCKTYWVSRDQLQQLKGEKTITQGNVKTKIECSGTLVKNQIKSCEEIKQMQSIIY